MNSISKSIIVICIFFGLYSLTSASSIFQHDDFCKKHDGIYAVNSYWKPSFVSNSPLGEVKQIVKKWSYIFISELVRNHFGDGVNDYTFEVYLNEYNCKTRELWMKANTGISPPSPGQILSPEIDMIDDSFIIVRAYDTYTHGYEHLYYDRKLGKDFNMVEAMNSIPNFNTILDYKPGRNGKWKVLIQFANMNKKWMNYDLHKKTIY